MKSRRSSVELSRSNVRKSRPGAHAVVKRLLPLLADSIAKMVNATLHGKVIPEFLKQTIVRSQLKSITLHLKDSRLRMYVR